MDIAFSRSMAQDSDMMHSDEILKRILFRLRGRVFHFEPHSAKCGDVLISYVTLPYLNTDKKALDAHTNRWESMCIVETFLEQGFAVDLIDTTNTTFIPKKKYDYFVDNTTNMDRLAPLLGPECTKVLHTTTSHWKFNNEAEKKRFDDVYTRRNVRLPLDRVLPANKAIEVCDFATVLGNIITASTYAYARKPITTVPISTTHIFESPEQKDFEKARKNFIWFGGAGVIHKGLDLVLEAFAEMPEYNLTICGKIEGEKDFKKIYEKELSLENIRVAGFMDAGSEEFKKLCDQSLALIYPSCAEGQSGGVVLTMHAGLIPIVSRESGVDVGDFGVILRENSIEQIKSEVKNITSLPAHMLKDKAVSAWKYARAHHTREEFSKTYREFVSMLLTKARV